MNKSIKIILGITLAIAVVILSLAIILTIDRTNIAGEYKTIGTYLSDLKENKITLSKAESKKSESIYYLKIEAEKTVINKKKEQIYSKIYAYDSQNVVWINEDLAIVIDKINTSKPSYGSTTSDYNIVSFDDKIEFLEKLVGDKYYRANILSENGFHTIFPVDQQIGTGCFEVGDKKYYVFTSNMNSTDGNQTDKDYIKYNSYDGTNVIIEFNDSKKTDGLMYLYDDLVVVEFEDDLKED